MLKYFGYVSYVLPIGMFASLYLFYENPFCKRSAELATAITLFYIALLMLDAFLVGGGIVGSFTYDVIIDFIGIGGYLIIIVCILLLGAHLAFDFSYSHLASVAIDKFKDIPPLPKISFPNVDLTNIKLPTKEAKKPDPPLLTNKNKILDLDPTPNTAGKTRAEINDYIKEKKLDAQIDPSALEDVSVRKINLILNTKDMPAKKDSALSSKPQQTKQPDQKKVLIVKELEENKRILDEIEKGESEKPKHFRLPSSNMLQEPKVAKKELNEAEIDAKIEDLLKKLRVFKIEGDIIRTYAGPVVTTFEFKPAAHIKVSKILSLEDDIAMALKAQTIRIQAPIPGKDVVGIEIPNIEIETIYLKEIVDSDLFKKSASPLTIILGKDIVGNPFVTDLRKLPHLLIAGTTGSGKSVGINAMILSLLYKNSPDNLKLVMVDPKMLEFSIYDEIPHLLTPVITEPKEAINAMANMVVEMDRRYSLMAKTKTKTIENYNEKAKKESLEIMPFIVVIIDELADLMMAGGKDVEISIARLAQKARACGIHLIIATQRPSTDVITGLIKANLPSRLSYRVGSKIDSKVILDQMGAASLLGRGDLLFTPPGSSNLVRLHAPWASEEEIDKISDFLRSQGPAQYDHKFLDSALDLASGISDDEAITLDEMYEQAKEIVVSEKKSSISYIQRRLNIGYNRSANIIEQLEKTGILSPPNARGQREVLV